MSQASAVLSNEKKGIELFGMPITLFMIPLFAILIGHQFDIIPKNLVGGFAIMFVLGIVFGEIGKRIPGFETYIGGAPVFAFLAAAFLVYKGIMTEREIEAITLVMKKAKFIDLFIVVLITGSILSVNRKLLLKSLVGYIPTILMGVIGAFILGGIGGLIFGISFKEIAMLYVLPIMGGGNGAGAIPLSEIYETATGNPKEVFYSFAISILTIANIIAIIVASLLNKLGKKKPELTGNGQLVRKGEFKVDEDEKPTGEVNQRHIAIGMILATSLYTLAYALSKKILPGFGSVQIHTYAYMVILVAMLNAANIVPAEIKAGAKKLQSFFSGQFMWLLMIGVGVCYTDLGEIIQAITFSNIIIAGMIVVGAVLGSSLGGYLMGFYPIESSITAGLCMANRGGSGDLEVLASSQRMDLISYAQISSRLGGGIILVIASVVFGLIG